MKIRKSILSFALAAIMIAPSFANNVKFENPSKSSKAITEIQSYIQSIDFNFEELANEKVKVHFMVNTANEIVVLRTNSQDVDSVLKRTLNYKELENRDLEVNKVYILPITFEEA